MKGFSVFFLVWFQINEERLDIECEVGVGGAQSSPIYSLSNQSCDNKYFGSFNFQIK